MNRVEFLDPLRSILMFLGVVLHTAQVYNPDINWLVSSPETFVGASYISQFIHSFRMPAFFVISGFFFAWSLAKYSVSSVLGKRLVRVCVPLLTVALTVNFLQYHLLWQQTSSPKYEYWQYWRHGHWISHLWFLINLVCYFILGTLGFLVVKRIANVTKFRQAKYPIWLIVVLLPLMHILVLSTNKFGFPLYQNVAGISVYLVFSYLPFFVFGMVLYSNKHLYHGFTNTSFFIGITLVVTAWSIGKFMNSPKADILATVVVNYCDYLATYVGIALLFTLFSKLFHNRTKFWQYFANASYSIYLLHQLIIVVISSYFVKVGVSPTLGFALIIILTTILTLVIHHVFIRSNIVVGFLFNGKWKDNK